MAITVRRAAWTVGPIAGGTLLKISIPEEYSQWFRGRFQRNESNRLEPENHRRVSCQEGAWSRYVGRPRRAHDRERCQERRPHHHSTGLWPRWQALHRRGVEGWRANRPDMVWKHQGQP